MQARSRRRDALAILPEMSERRGFAKFLIGLLAPFVLILAGAGLAALGFTQAWWWLFWTGLIVAAAGVLWGAILLLVHGPTDV